MQQNTSSCYRSEANNGTLTTEATLNSMHTESDAVMCILKPKPEPETRV